MSGTLLIPREQNIVRQLRTILDDSDERRSLGRARRALTIGPDATAAAELMHAAETLRPVIDQQRGRAALAAVDSVAGEPPPDAAAVAAEGDRIGRRQVLLIVMDLLRRSITRATGPDTHPRDCAGLSIRTLDNPFIRPSSPRSALSRAFSTSRTSQAAVRERRSTPRKIR